jgi:signal transduction histidine kinase
MLRRLVLTGALGATLIAIALLQYRWIGEVSEAEQQRMRAGLFNTVNQFRRQIGVEIQQLGLAPLVLNRRAPDAPVNDKDLEPLRALLPELVRQYFESPDGYDYQVAIVSAGKFIYRSDPQLTLESFARPDARAGLLRNPEGFRPRGSGPPQGPPPNPPPFFGSEPPPRGGFGSGPMPPRNNGFDWELLVKHREGSLAAAVAAVRRRNLAISSGTLLLLAVSMALIILSARRAQALARLQIDFVAGISHELRTPLSVICSASDNLAEGAVSDSKKYGELIRGEGRKLAGLIDQIMQFAGTQRGRRRYNLQPARIEDLVEEALEQAEPQIEAARFSVEKSLAPDLPEVLADVPALVQAIQNLVQNAIKFSGDRRRLKIRARPVRTRGKTEVQLGIEDEGIGISRRDLAHIFEPFYRGEAATGAQIHGTGLGLYMVREALAGMKGRITVKSTPGKGSVFTIHLPAHQSAVGSG